MLTAGKPCKASGLFKAALLTYMLTYADTRLNGQRMLTYADTRLNCQDDEMMPGELADAHSDESNAADQVRARRTADVC